MVGDSGKGRCVRMCREARVQARMIQGKNRKMGNCLALNKATSRPSGQRRDVPERESSNVATFGATSRRSRGG